MRSTTILIVASVASLVTSTALAQPTAFAERSKIVATGTQIHLYGLPTRSSSGAIKYFDVTVDTTDDHHFVFYELYSDEAAINAHRAAPHFAVWRKAAAEHVVPGSQVNTITERLRHHA